MYQQKSLVYCQKNLMVIQIQEEFMVDQHNYGQARGNPSIT